MDTTLVAALVVVAVIVVAVLATRKKKPEEPARGEALKEFAEKAKAASLPPPSKAPSEAPPKEERAPSVKPPPREVAEAAAPPEAAFPTTPPPGDAPPAKTPPSAEEIAAEQILDAAPAEKKVPPATPSSPPPLPKGRPALRSYSSITDESIGSAARAKGQEVVEAKAPPAAPIPKPEVKLPTSEPKPPARLPSTPKMAAVPKPATPVSEPLGISKPTPAAKIEPAKPAPVAEAKAPAPEPAKPAAPPPAAATAPAKKDDLDFSGANEPAPAPKPAAAPATAAARYAPPSNPATAELEKSDPRHAAARRLARVSVSGIKLYHEEEVKAGREAKDLYKRLGQDIALAKQTFEARVVLEVRERFDYLLDEIIRQLAEGDPKKLGPDAPPIPANMMPGGAAVAPAAPPEAPKAALPAQEPPTAVRPVLEPPPEAKPPAAEVKPAPAKPAPDAPAKPAVETKPAAAAATPAAAARPVVAPSAETAELEKGDPRHAAARRLARLSVSEIKLYHEDEVKTGREAKDLWKRLITDIGLATQTYEKRVDAEVRGRFDYLYDEILRQLAEGDVTKLGPDAPKSKTGAAPAAEAPKADAAPAKAEPAPVKAEPAKAEPAPVKAEPAKAEPPKAEPAKAEAAPAPAPAVIPARFAPPTNPATAELEKSDPRHAAARRLARLSVSEIKLYHEDEVKAGREAKDLWKRLITDIGLATQTYEKRVDKEVRERFDYLYDEVLRQLAEGDPAKLGPEAPARKQ